MPSDARTVADIMSHPVVTVDMDSEVHAIQRTFVEQGFHHLPVLSKEEVVGIVSDRDILKNTSPFLGKATERQLDAATLKRKAHQIMSRNPVTINKGRSLAEAASLMIDKRVHCLPVVGESGQLEGIITATDLILAMQEEAGSREPEVGEDAEAPSAA